MDTFIVPLDLAERALGLSFDMNLPDKIVLDRCPLSLIARIEASKEIWDQLPDQKEDWKQIMEKHFPNQRLSRKEASKSSVMENIWIKQAERVGEWVQYCSQSHHPDCMPVTELSMIRKNPREAYLNNLDALTANFDRIPLPDLVRIHLPKDRYVEVEHMEAVLRSLNHRLEVTKGELVIRNSESKDPTHGFDESEVDQAIKDLIQNAKQVFQATHPK